MKPNSSPLRLLCLGVALTIFPMAAQADEFLPVHDVELQPLAAATERLVEALQFVGAPLKPDDAATLQAALKQTDARKLGTVVQSTLDPYCVVGVNINPESRVSVTDGPVKKELVQQGWRTFLVKVRNEAGINPELQLDCPNIAPIFKSSTNSPRPKSVVTMNDVPLRWMDAVLFNKQPLAPKLSGLGLEYRIIQIYSRDAGKREAKMGFNVGQGSQDIGFRNATSILFTCLPAVEVTLGVKDFDGQPTTASFLFRDQQGRVYPNPARRLAPDFFFHDQVYRADGETVQLPSGDYTVSVTRGPEYFIDDYKLTIPAKATKHKFDVELRRWTHVAKRGWYSGDHHVHAAGCKHYENPTEGVTPADMMRHFLGEDLNVGCVLSWGPCWYTQKQYFEGKTSALSKPDYLMRYDVEVSGFPSSHAGHLCLLRLTEDDYPGTDQIEQWPSWTGPVLAWGKKQGAVVGYSHSGPGLNLPDYLPDGSRSYHTQGRRLPPEGWNGRAADKLPDYAMPPFDGIGANEYIVTTTQGICDFISTVDTPSVWELNIWYHTLNCGMRTRISGETDFPCVYGQKVGLGRVYVQLDDKTPLNYDNWIAGVRDGRSYCCDGTSHLLDFRVDGLAVGQKQKPDLEPSLLKLDGPSKVHATVDVAAFLRTEKPTDEDRKIHNTRLDQQPYWHIERARIGETREVPVEIIVNGYPAAKKNIVADGKTQNLSFDIDIPHSSWVAVRIFPSSHTNPVFVEVAGKPIRASRRSADWCLRAVDTCWKSKEPRIRESEKADAKSAYAKAREIYAAILKEAVAE